MKSYCHCLLFGVKPHSSWPHMCCNLKGAWVRVAICDQALDLFKGRLTINNYKQSLSRFSRTICYNGKVFQHKFLLQQTCLNTLLIRMRLLSRLSIRVRWWAKHVHRVQLWGHSTISKWPWRLGRVKFSIILNFNNLGLSVGSLSYLLSLQVACIYWQMLFTLPKSFFNKHKPMFTKLRKSKQKLEAYLFIAAKSSISLNKTLTSHVSLYIIEVTSSF